MGVSAWLRLRVVSLRPRQRVQLRLRGEVSGGLHDAKVLLTTDHTQRGATGSALVRKFSEEFQAVRRLALMTGLDNLFHVLYDWVRTKLFEKCDLDPKEPERPKPGIMAPKEEPSERCSNRIVIYTVSLRYQP